MQLLSPATESATLIACAADVLDVVPLAMRAIRREMRSHRAAGLSVPQFRTLCFLSRFGGSSLSAVAEWLDLSLPSMSRLVNNLVTRGYVQRRTCDNDRRHVRLSLSMKGQAAMRSARKAAEAQLGAELAAIPADQRAAVRVAMDVLRELFEKKETSFASE